MSTMQFTAPIRLVSEANQRCHWATRSPRTKKHRWASRMLCQNMFGRPPVLPVRVELTRIAPRELDDDNLRSAFKAIRDGIADWLGVLDNDKRIRWDYGQKPGGVKVYAIKVEITQEAA